MAATTLTGTTGNDLLNAPGSVSTLVQGLAGNDTINLSLISDEAAAGAGDDTIGLTATGIATNTIFGGAGNDTVFIQSANQFAGYVDLGAGTDSIAVSTATLIIDADIFGNEGADTIRLQNTITNSTIGAGSGADVITLTGNAITNALVFGGKQQDTITVNGLAASSFVSLGGGRGNDVIQASGAGALATSLIGGGKGTDSIRVGTAAVGSVAGGGLADTIRLQGGFGGGRVYGDAVGVTTVGTGTGGAADGADSIVIDSLVNAATSVYGGGGKDTIFVASGANSATSTLLAVVDGGNGNDSIRFVGTGAAAVFDGTLVKGGAGADTINIASAGLGGASTYSQASTINGGAGTDLIVYGGAGTDAAFVDGLTNNAATLTLASVSGDTLNVQLANTGASNWNLGAPTIYVATSGTRLDAGLTTNGNIGAIGVYSNGTDTLIAINASANGASFFSFIVRGADLVLTTQTATDVTLTASNFGFSVAGADTGINITFS